MELNLKLQRNEERRLDRYFAKKTKQYNRHHIVEDMIEVRKAKKRAVSERTKYYSLQKIPAKKSKLTRWYETSRLKRRWDRFVYKLKTKLYSYESIYMYVWHTILDAWDYIKSKKVVYIPIAALIVLLIMSGISYQYLTGYEITFNGYTIGTVANLKVLDEAMSNVNANLSDWYDNDSLYYEQSITIKNTLITDRDELLDPEECEEALYACDFPLFVDGAVITIDGVETVRLASTEDAQEAIDKLMALYVGEDSDTVQVMASQVSQDIEVEEKIIQMGTEYSVDDAVAYLETLSADQSSGGTGTSDTTSISTLVASSSDTKGLISALNFRSDEFSVGDTTTSKPSLSITTVKEVVYEDNVDYDTTYTDDPDSYIGTETVVSDGVAGTKEVTALITYVNGEETSREVLSETVTEEPVSEVVARGSKILPPAQSTGSFVIPASGTITTIYGTRAHAGGCAVDIATSTGSNVYASDSGVVTKATYYGSYGNCIIIDHGNGYTTLYAHLSGYNVSVGDEVSQGQVIGYVGSTGYSTGPHLHFEIRYDNVRQKILNYFTFSLGQSVTALN